jgi:hypothetical protein
MLDQTRSDISSTTAPTVNDSSPASAMSVDNDKSAVETSDPDDAKSPDSSLSKDTAKGKIVCQL